MSNNVASLKILGLSLAASALILVTAYGARALTADSPAIAAAKIRLAQRSAGGR